MEQAGADAPCCPAEEGPAAEEHAQAALDLALQLLNHWCAVGKPELAVAWGSALAADAGSISAEAPATDAGVLRGSNPCVISLQPEILSYLSILAGGRG